MDRPVKGLPALLFVAVIVAFSPVLANGFVNWDDPQNFLENPHFRGLGPTQVRWAWTTAHLGVYQPLGWMGVGAEYALFGLSAWGYHLTSVLLHATCAVALYGLIREILSRCEPGPVRLDRRTTSVLAALAALIFAVHPLRVEPVAWASCQTYLPCALFAILATHAYLQAHPPSGPTRHGWLVVSFLLYTAAVLAKAPAMSLPIVLLILDATPLRRVGPGPGQASRWRACFLEKIPFLVVAALLSAVAVVARESGGSPIPVPRFGVAVRFALACYGAAFTIARTLLPFGLAAHYPLPDPLGWRTRPLAASVALVVGLTALTWLQRRKWPGLLAGWGAFLALLAPNVNLVWIEPRLAKDRSTYVASLVLAVMLAGGLVHLVRRLPRAKFPIVVAVLVVATVLTGLTWRQCRTWRDSVALWTQVLAAGGSTDVLVHVNLGEALVERGRLHEALRQYQAAVRVAPCSAEAHSGLGVVLGRLGRTDEALNHLLEAIRLNADLAEAHNSLGLVLARQGRLEEAAPHFAMAVRLRPDFDAARANLSEALNRLGRPNGEIELPLSLP
jgi:tetratricopeptide (TPR) repeat protein